MNMLLSILIGLPLGALVALGMLVYAACLAAFGFRLRDFSRRGVE